MRAAAGFFLLLCSSVAAAAPEKVTSVEGATEYRLPNGLSVLLYPDPSQAKITVGMSYRVGSRHEGYGETGMAHLLEHMLFKGTARHPRPKEELAARGALNNANTWYDRTFYFETLPATDDSLTFALEFEADRMVNCPITAEALSTEFSVVRNEFERGENSPGNVLGERVVSTAFLFHNYGKPTIGSRADIERVPAGALRRFYQQYYRPDNAMLIVTGMFDPARALALAEQYFGPLPRPKEPVARTYTVEPVQDGERSVMLRRKGDVQIVEVVYHIMAAADERYPAIKALELALTDEPTGRLYKALVATGMATHVGAWSLTLADPGWVDLTAEVPVGKSAQAVLDRMTAIVEDLGKNGLTTEELERFRNRWLKNFDLAMASSSNAAARFNEANGAGDWRLVYLMRDRVEKLDAAAATRVAAAYFVPANRTWGMFLPASEPPLRAPLTEGVDVAALVAGYQGKPPPSEGEEFDATLENIEKRTVRKVLPGGLKLALLPKETHGDVVVAQLALHYGTEQDLAGDLEVHEMIGELLTRGTRRLTEDQIDSEIDRLKAQLSVSVSRGAAVVSMKTVRANLPALIALASEILREPAFPKDKLEVEKKRWITSLEASLQNPADQSRLALDRRLAPYPPSDVRYVPTTRESIARVKKVTLARVRRAYASLWGASRAELAVVGDFDPETLTAAVEKGLGDWRSPKPFVRVATPYRTVPAATEVIDTPDKESAQVMVGLSIEMRDDDPDYPALRMAIAALGAGAEARLFLRLREKEGWSYGAYASMWADAIDRRGRITAEATMAPPSAAKAQAALVEEIARLVKDGVDAKELGRVKSTYLGQFRTSLASDDTVAGLLRSGLYLDRTLAFQMKLNAAIAALGPDDVARVLAKGMLQVDRLVKVTAGDVQKAAGAGTGAGGKAAK